MTRPSKKQKGGGQRPSPAWTPFERACAIPVSQETIEQTAKAFEQPIELVAAAYKARVGDELWKNNRYQVAIVRETPVGKGFPPMIHLSIKRLDRNPVRDWRDLQRIKNELVGPEHEGVELYPAESRLTDTANQFHVWVLAREGMRFPFGWDDGRNIMESSTAKSKQRPFEGDRA